MSINTIPRAFAARMPKLSVAIESNREPFLFEECSRLLQPHSSLTGGGYCSAAD